MKKIQKIKINFFDYLNGRKNEIKRRKIYLSNL